MGSIISLGIDNFEIDWGKNNHFLDHSVLFLPSDVSEIPYQYANGETKNKEGYSRKLSSVKKRLDLLGYSLKSLRKIFYDHVESIPDYYPDIPISFEQFFSAFISIDIDQINPDEMYADYSLGEYVSRYIFQIPEIKNRLPSDIEIDSDLGTFFENLHPYILLRILAEKDEYSERYVHWDFADVVDNGWVDRADVVKELPSSNKILVVTEGTSDSCIIERALSELRPEIADFFYFVDMEEHYPFTGTGNLFRFCQGLSRIQIQNKVLVLFDNDAAGVETFQKLQSIAKPSNMHFCMLPEHELFSNFQTIGPHGNSYEDINGSAVAIECFLDLNTVTNENRCVRWTSFNDKLHRYQGSIIGKNMLVKEFHKANLTDGSYDTSRLKFLLDHLVEEWVENVV